MFEAERHFTPTFRAWDPAEVRAAIAEITADTVAALDPLTLWPAHPLDDVEGDTGSVYFGAAGLCVPQAPSAHRRGALAFAMASIDQMRAARATYGCGRHSLWTGDPGLAVYLSDCLGGEPAFPTIDVF